MPDLAAINGGPTSNRHIGTTQRPTTGVYPRADRAHIPVIARLLWPDREEWRAVTARRWTLVFVTWPPERGKPGGWCWLKLEDVRRVIVIPR